MINDERDFENLTATPLSTFIPGTLCFCKSISYGTEMQTKNGRPAIILGNEEFNATSSKVTVVYLSHTCYNSDIHICTNASCGAKFTDSYVHIEEVATVDKRRLFDFQCVITEELLNRVKKALAKFNGLYDTCDPTEGLNTMPSPPINNAQVESLKSKIEELTKANEVIKEKCAKLQKALKATVDLM